MSTKIILRYRVQGVKYISVKLVKSRHRLMRKAEQRKQVTEEKEKGAAGLSSYVSVHSS